MSGDIDKFNKAKDEAEKFYKNIGKVYCPYLKDSVSFNVKGLDHIKFSDWNKTRPLKDQYIRLRLLPLAPRIVRESNTLQEFSKTIRQERRRVNAVWEIGLVETTYYGFVAVINKCRLKIIVKEISGGSKYFWSIIPFWKNRRYNDGSNKKILHEGDLELQ
jgi:hypothetical protein